eukprot:jgi/Chrzof1/12482/Cz06g35270.t1
MPADKMCMCVCCRFIANTKEVTASTALCILMNGTSAWQYVTLNGPGALFDGYAWSLDTFVDYCYSQLGALTSAMIVLLVIEAVLCQLFCMVYSYMILVLANTQHMKLFSVFLLLPSATIRAMAARPCQVDDDHEGGKRTGSGGGLNGIAEVAGEPSAKQSADRKQKSVRMSVEGGDYHRHQQDMDANEDDDGTVQAVLTVAKTGASVSQQGRTPTAFSNDLQPPQTDTASTLKPSGLDWHRLHKRLFGWVPKHQKMNGKRLVPDNKITYKFMVSKTV